MLFQKCTFWLALTSVIAISIGTAAIGLAQDQTADSISNWNVNQFAAVSTDDEKSMSKSTSSVAPPKSPTAAKTRKSDSKKSSKGRTRQEKKQPGKKTKAPKQEPTALTVKRRLPRYYGKLILTDAQREKVYQVQAEYAAKLEKLQSQMLDLKSEMGDKCRDVLTKGQQQNLDRLLADSKNSRKSASR